MKQFCESFRKSFFFKYWYLLALAGIISLTAFQTGKEDLRDGPLMHMLPDSLTSINHGFAEQLVKESSDGQIADSLVDFARRLEGKPYHWGGTTLRGFDCSGFVSYVYRHFGHSLNRSSSSQSTQGKLIKLEEARKGDLLFFTGTNPNTKQVGHVGIVISAAEDDIRFVHSSSNGGVKVSELEGYYASRFLKARRVLNHL